MKIETLANLLNGELLNSPYISEVVHFTDNVDEVNRGSCFFARKISDIVFAIKNGAYAIVVDKDVDILDDEIAWIKIDEFNKGIFEIFKYENVKSEIYKIGFIEKMIIKAINQDKRVVILEDDIFSAINMRDKFIFTTQDFPKAVPLQPREYEISQIGLFKSNFENIQINLPYVYKEEFLKVIGFFRDNEIKHTLEFELERFKPVYVDGLFREVEFGGSSKVLITNLQNDSVFFKELNFIVENTKHAKTVFIDRYNFHMINEEFNFGVLVGVEFTPKRIEEGELFD
ncbi:MAG: hypothetical protein GXO62_08150 [Epsilonproteobacteria bacterium]|nr:hypothetical protein [Campylobacterota bacterium]